MRPPRLARLLLGAYVVIATGACRRIADPDPLVGTFLATTFRVTPAGQSEVNVLAQGGTLGVNVANNFVTAGTLIVPASLNGGGATFTASMAGSAVRTESTVRLTQSADTFVRNLTFTLSEDALEAIDQTVGGATYRIVLTRQ
jgi:hypothetical protein